MKPMIITENVMTEATIMANFRVIENNSSFGMEETTIHVLADNLSDLSPRIRN